MNVQRFFILLPAAGLFLSVSVRGGDVTGRLPAGMDRSPVDVALSPDGRWLVTANESSNSVSLIRIEDRCLLDERRCGRHPTDIVFSPDGQMLLVSCSWSGTVELLQIAGEQLEPVASIDVGYEPCGLAVAADGTRAFVGLVAAGEVAELDLTALRVRRRLPVGHWPRYLTLSPDGSRLAVGCAGEGRIAVLDTDSGDTLHEAQLANGINLGHMVTSDDGLYAYFTWMVYRTNPISVSNIQRGWVLASRIGRVRMDRTADREAISLDVPRKAVSDPHGIVISDDGRRLVASASGTHELLVYRLTDLPFVATGGPGDLIERELQNDRDRFDRIELGGRPMGMAMAGDNRTLCVANYLRNSVQIVDIEAKRIISEIDLGGPEEPSLARRGMAIFYDGQQSLDQWYSCHSCHQNGGINSRPMDTMNDGSQKTLKTVLPLYHVTKTEPWTWHGWQTSLEKAVHTSITATMQGEAPSDDAVAAVVAFLEQLEAPPNPFRNADGSLTESAERGRQVFVSRKARCVDCHSGKYLTDGRIHDVGLGSPKDHYEGYNTPSLVGVYRKVRLLHSGRAQSLERVIDDLHSPKKVSGTERLTDDERADLIEYLRSL